ncbi:M20/M25/M40 family metallo-hydrolase [Granulicella sibirica]|uniref:Aminopeptidase Y n=1 Tax=Granulicella sibirica TaxID=2479048 RepID=A0A4Q0T6W0_9BACT|nr:M20/M25/M40 family metallo-hydrolase [Granulicella sibirica]RXH57331.1 Aminopeptidase Y [Granulicella sibirica]
MRSPSRSLQIASFLLSTIAFAQTPVPQRVQTGFNAIKESTLRANLTFIAGDGLLGRMSLQPGDEASAEWVASEFAKAGLQPAAKDASGYPSFLQPVPLVEYKPDTGATRLTLTGPATGPATKSWTSADITSSFRQNVDVTGGLVYVGYGITAPELNYDDYANVDVHGKVVLLMEHEPQEDDPKSIFNGTGNTRYATNRVKLLNAQKHGAIAVLLMPEPNATHISTNKRLMAVYVGVNTKRLTPLPLQAIVDDETHISSTTIPLTVAADLLQPANATAKALQTAIDKDLQPQSREIPGVQLHLETRNASTRTGTAYNVAGLLPGSDPTLSAETVLISAHHDHNGASEVEDPDGKRHLEIWHGADDNGSGTVGVVELAHAFTANPVKPKRSILFVVFAAEERGPLQGSYYMSNHPLRPLATTRAMINCDMIGRDEAPSPQTDGAIEIPKDTTNRLNLIGSLYAPDLLKIVQHEDQHVGLILDDRFDRDTALGIFFRSDQFPFILHDVPALWFFTGFHPDYHHVTDTVDRIDFTKMTKIIRLAYLSLFDIADNPVPPRFIANPALGR